jgi:hypothetical protein
MKRRFGWLVLLSLLILALGAQVALAAPSGAIFTTVADGSRVNANIYPAKTAVYLDGGPGPNAPSTAAGLDEGWYVFQVTDPSGKVLLSQDPVICRQFYVSADGVITKVRGGDWTVKGKTNYFEHATGIDKDHSELGAITVQLMPYLDTPNPGGVYKAWAMRYDDFVAVNGENALSKVDPPGTRFHGFVPSMSKTDNYKVKGKPEQRLIVKKFCDANANGVWDLGENEITEWPIKIIEPSGVTWDPTFTPVNIISQLTGDWWIWEYDKPLGDSRTWQQTALYVDGVKLPTTMGPVAVSYGLTDGETHTVVFGNVPLGDIVAHKFHDKDCDGTQDPGEENVPNYKFTLTGTGGAAIGYSKVIETDANGIAKFTGLLPGQYTLVEESKEGWLPTTPTSKVIDLKTCSPMAVCEKVEFGNVKPVEFCVFKFVDVNGNGKYDAGDAVKTDWKFELSGKDKLGNEIGPLPGVTGADGKVCWDKSVKLYPGDYVVKEIMPADSKWVVSALAYQVNGGDLVVKTPAVSLAMPAGAGEKWDVSFGNCEPGCIKGYKFWDKNGDGIRDEATDTPVEGWKITLKGKTGMGVPVEIVKYTDANGEVSFCDLWPGEYELIEDTGDPNVWFATSATSSGTLNLKSDGFASAMFLNCKYAEIKVCKFEDKNGNGVVDEGEPKVAKFGINLTGGPAKEPVNITKETGEDGCVVFAKLKPGKYVVKELIPEGSDWKPTALYYRATEGAEFVKADGTPIEMTLDLGSGEKGAVKFLNCKPGCIEVEKFYDRDGDGNKDGDEGPVKGVKIVLSGTETFDGAGDGTAVNKTAYTDEFGKAKFCGLWPGTYSVTEVLPPDGVDYVWVATTPKTIGDIVVKSQMTEGPYLFGNRCEKRTCFYTKGFWHNKNGTDLITSGDVSFLNSLAPFAAPAASWKFGFDGVWDPTGNTYFGTGAIGEISDFITASESRDAIPQRFQLMQQLTAYVLNVRHYAGGWDAVISTPSGMTWKAQDLLDAALAAWASADPNECSKIEKILDTYNNCTCVAMVCPSPCPIPEY